MFDKKTKLELIQIFKRTIDGIRKDVLCEPADLGVVAGLLREVVSQRRSGKDDFDAGFCGDADFDDRQLHYFMTGEILPEGVDTPRMV